MTAHRTDISRLTVRTLQSLKPRNGPYLVHDGRGLYIKVQPSGAKSWLYRYHKDGTSHDCGLGTYPELGLAEARERAIEWRRVKMDGKDPIAAKKAIRAAALVSAAKVMTFQQCAEAYIAAHRTGWRNPKHAAQWPATLSAYVYPVFGKLPVAAV